MKVDDFWARVDRRGSGECWEWTGARLRRGYGWVRWEGHNRPASRIAWLLFFGPVPDGLWVLHRCDNPPCCNPAHLFLGDRQANVDDMMAKGRHGTVRGEAQKTSKLTEADVREARAAHAGGESLHSLARRFRVSRPTISSAVKGKTWRHV